MSRLSVSYKKYTLRFKKPAGTSRGFLNTRETFFIRLAGSSDPGRIGLGECGPLRGLSLDDRPDFETQVAQVCNQLNRGRSPEELDLAEFPALAFGLETAWRDWERGGNRLLYETDFSLGRASIPIHGLIWMADQVAMLRQVHEKVAQGFTCLKLKVGALDFQAECRLLTEIRQTCPADQIELRLDANGAFAPETALEHLTALARFQIQSIEQPIKPGQWSDMARLCADSPIKIALDEELIGIKTKTDKRRLLETIRPHYIVLKPTLVGGLAAAEEWIDIAQRLGIGWWVNSMLESNLGLNAICQWVSALETRVTQGLGTGRLFSNNIPSPIRLAGTGLIYDPNLAWNVSEIVS